MNALAVIDNSANVDAYRASTNAASVCKDIVVATASTIQGRKYVNVEGWQAIAIAHGCAASARDVEKVDGGVRAIGEIRRMSDGALISQAEGFVGEDEETWYGGKNRWGKEMPKRADYAIRAMAQTRAISRACRSAFAHVVVMMNAGLATTPAEEVPHEGFQDNVEPKGREDARQSEPPAVVVISEVQRRQLMALGTTKKADSRKLCEAVGVESIREMPVAKFQAALDWLNALPATAPANPQSSEMLADEIPY